MSATIIALPGVRLPTRRAAKKDPREAAARKYRTRLLAEASGRAKASSDPIFAAIEVHLAAVVTKLNHTDDTSEMTFKEEQADEPYSSRLADRCDETLRTVLSASPQTWEGVVALLEHVALNEFLDPESKVGDDECSGHETFLTTFNECFGESKRFSQTFPLHLAEAIRGLMQTAPSAA
jgi:hypothetical protein